MADHKVVSHDQWLDARKSLLAEERQFTRLREELSQERRELPWEGLITYRPHAMAAARPPRLFA
jgi:predicted dithiol-disulfide oxidoreductase (DUF899 family)